MAPVLAIADLVADRCPSMPIVTPLERLRHPSQPGRLWSHSREEHQHGQSTPSRLNRKQRRALTRRLRDADPGLDIIHPNAAASTLAIAPTTSPSGRIAIPIRCAGLTVLRPTLHRLADWLQQCGVTTVAMQSTGVYWLPLYDILDGRGFEVYLVNASHTKNLPGRKSDVQESQWLLKLHTYGLLRNSFYSAAEIRVVRTYWRQRADHVRGVSTCIQRMQKVLTQMNIQLANVISDLSGWTGQRIVRAILAGERDPQRWRR